MRRRHREAERPRLPSGNERIPEEEEMKGFSSMSRAFIAAIVGLAASASVLPAAHSQESTIANDDGVLVDGQSFKITPGLSKRDAAGLISGLGARELGPGAIIFRSEGKLYIVDAPLRFEGTPGNLMAGLDRPNRIRIEYVPPKNPEHQRLYDRIRENRLLEVVQAIFSPFRFPVDLVVKTMGCDGKVNAWYSKDDTGDTGPTLHVCYELLQYLLKTAPNEPTPAGITPRDAIVGQFMAWITHEMGHAVYDMYQVPQWGGRERVADLFAAYVMLQFGPERARRLIGGTTYAFKQFMKKYQENPEVQYRLAEFADVHDFPQQRFYNIICMAYGADPKTFAYVADILPKERAGNCKYEYQDFRKAWRSRIMPHIDQQLARQVLDTTWLPRTDSSVSTR